MRFGVGAIGLEATKQNEWEVIGDVRLGVGVHCGPELAVDSDRSPHILG